MKYIKLGDTDIEISRICVGGLSFGDTAKSGHKWLLDPAACREMLAHALDLGVNFIDTANTYAQGTSESYIGEALKSLGVPRDKVVIATKVFFNLTTEEHLTRRAIFAEIDGSLRRLGVDFIDLYQIHRFDENTPIEETMEALHDLVVAGKVRAIGASAMYGYQLHNMQVVAEKNGWTRFSSMQDHYNLIYREDEREVIPVCKQYNMSIIPFSPLAAGHLARKTWDGATERSRTDKVAMDKYERARNDDLPVIMRVNDLADKYSVSMSEVALAWLYAKGVAAPIVGATKMKHFDAACRAIDLSLTDEDIAYLEELYRPHEIVGQSV